MRIATPGRCPRCGERALIGILYGTPDDPALHGLWLQGKAMIREGTCPDGPPGWMCRECGYEYTEYRATLRTG
jgi:predicted Zn-ribbon and HTH transcriptional regulator